MVRERLLGRLFPFHIRISASLDIVELGPSLEKVVRPGCIGESLFEHFQVVRPRLRTPRPSTLDPLLQKLVVLLHGETKLQLRGEIIPWLESSELLLAMTPVLTRVEDLERYSLYLSDFAWHDPISDLLFAIQVRDKSLAEARALQEDLEHKSRELDEARMRAEASAAAKGRFLAVMSHELRTPMNAIIGLSGLLKSTLEPGEPKELAATIERSSESLLKILNDILDFSKVEAGKVELVDAPYCPPRLVREVESLLSVQAKAKGIGFSVELPPSEEIYTMGDESRLRQVLLNLGGNAVKFTARGEVVVALSVEAPEIRIEVRDTGIGMTPGQVERLFSPFAQAEASINRTYGGTGLGLYISKQLVELMGGHLEVESELGKGSAFLVRLPFRRAAPAATAREEALSVPPGRALVVDDSRVNLLVAKKILAGLGWEADTVESGAAALERLEGHRYDLVLLDKSMPEMDGLECARLIRLNERKGQPRSVLVALTANAFDEDKASCFAAGMDDFLAKPLRRGELAEVLVRWVGP